MRKFMLPNLGAEALISPFAVAVVLPGSTPNTCAVTLIGRVDPMTVGAEMSDFTDWLSLYWEGSAGGEEDEPGEDEGESEEEGGDESEEEEEDDGTGDDTPAPATDEPLPLPPELRAAQSPPSNPRPMAEKIPMGRYGDESKLADALKESASTA